MNRKEAHKASPVRRKRPCYSAPSDIKGGSRTKMAKKALSSNGVFFNGHFFNLIAAKQE